MVYRVCRPDAQAVPAAALSKAVNIVVVSYDFFITVVMYILISLIILLRWGILNLE